MIPGFWGFIKQGGILQGYPFAQKVFYVGSKAPVWGQRVDTIADAFGVMNPNDILMLGPQQHAEGNLVIPVGLDNITIIGAGNRGSCFIEPEDTGDEGLQVLADGVTLVNVGVASEATGAYALKIGSTTVSPARFRAFQCKFEGNEAVNPAAQVVLQGCGDIIFDDCEFAWGANGIIGDANNDGFPTEILIQNCLFHDLTTVGVGIAAADHFVNLWLYGNRFALSEAGTPPTDFILLSDNANIGHIAGNLFASPTNAAGTITIGTGLIYGPNGTEAGWSTARPA